MKNIRQAMMALCAGLFLMLAAAPLASVQAQQVYQPTAQALNEDKLLQALKPGQTVNGRVSIPDQRSANLIRPSGREWQDFRRGPVSTTGAVAILGMLALLVAFFLLRGRIRVEKALPGAL